MINLIRNKRELVYSSSESKLEKKINRYVSDMGLKYDYKMNRTVYGIYQGYPVLIHSLMTPRNRTSLYQLVINLTPSDKITRKELEKKSEEKLQKDY